jgi:hypothetical protein
LINTIPPVCEPEFAINAIIGTIMANSVNAGPKLHRTPEKDLCIIDGSRHF